MNWLRKERKTILNGTPVSIAALIIMMAVVLGACGGGSADRVRQEQLNEVKESTVENLNDILYDLEERIEFLEGHIKEAEGDAKAEFEEANETLEEQKKRIEQKLVHIDEATLDTWNDVIDKTSVVIQEVRSATNEAIRDIRELVE